MKKTKIVGTDEYLYQEKLDNGLTIYVVPNDKTEFTYATFTTKYGGNINEFVPINEKEMLKVPAGIAHFLEHKMFESEDGVDPFQYYAETGTSANAFTSGKRTSYLFKGNKNLINNLMYLLDYVQTPYFTDENVEKEKGIIEQEVKMTEDDPNWIKWNHTLNSCLINDPAKTSVIGTVDDIRSITKEQLYKCYHTFYHPTNMFVIVTGNANPEEIITSIKNNQASKKIKAAPKIKLPVIKEPNHVKEKYVEVKKGVSIPKFSYNIKIELADIDKEKQDIYYMYLLSKLFSNTSIFDSEAKEKGYLTESLEFSTYITSNHILLLIEGATKYYQEVIQMIEETLKDKEITEEEVKRFNKVEVSNFILAFDSVSTVNRLLSNSLIEYNHNCCEYLSMIKKMTAADINEFIKTRDFSNRTVVVIKD